MNPLFADEPTSTNTHNPEGYVLPRQERRVEPLANAATEGGNPAVELIRRKIDALYTNEPDAAQELAEAENTPIRSKHQQKMHELSTSGKSLAEIQSAWHAYYIGLPDNEKREVWQEFYAAHNRQPSAYTKYVTQTKPRQPEKPTTPELPKIPHPIEPKPAASAVVVADHEFPPYAPSDQRSFSTIKKQVLHNVRARNKSQLKAKEHLQSLAFGLGLGSIVLLIILFGLFNNLVIAPFIRPGGHAEATPIILSTDGIAPSNKDEVIIPKINVQLPYVTTASTNEADVQAGLEEGVVRYPTTAQPGEKGNAAFFGHSSNNIFNKGKYKFAFVLLDELVPGDIFYLTHKGKAYTYKVYDKKVVNPEETWVLDPVQNKTATAVLITCDPPGTTLRRLVVWGEQINPDPNGNTTQTTPPPVDAPDQLPSDGPSMWSRVWNTITPW